MKFSVSTRPWPEPLATAAYHGVAGELVTRIRENTEADEAALLIQFLVGFGNLVGRGPRFVVGADTHHANEFALLVGETSRGRKGTSWSQSRRALVHVDPLWARNRMKSGLSSGEGLIWDVRDAHDATGVAKAGTQSGLEQAGGVTDKRLLVFEPEFASVLRVMRREGSTLSAVIRQAWDSGSLGVLAKNAKATATDAHISIVGHITRDEFVRTLDRTEAANGFLNRFIPFVVKRSRLLPDGGDFDSVDLVGLRQRISAVTQQAGSIGVVTRDLEARELWSAEYARLTQEIPGLLGAVTSRSEAHVVRLSLLYALLDASSVIRADHMRAALEVWRYAEASARYIFGDALGDPLADELLLQLRRAPAGLTRSDLTKRLGGHISGAVLDEGLNRLHTAGRVDFRNESTGGRPAQRWFASSADEARSGADVLSLTSHLSQFSAREGTPS